MINKVTLLGRIGKKDFKPTKNGSHICMLSIATSRKYIDSSGQSKEITNWHNVNFFNKLAEIANKYANVGDLIYVEGEISNKKIEENGVNRVIHSVIGSELKLLPNNKRDSQAAPEPQAAPTSSGTLEDIFNSEELPY